MISSFVKPPKVVNQLSTLLKRDLDFESSDSLYASHALHPFAAKFPPQIPRLFIAELSQSGDSILDPMAGSGTTIVEAALLRREAFGFDIDPLALRLCRVKTTFLNARHLEKTGIQIIQEAQRLRTMQDSLIRDLHARFDLETQKFLDYWFLPETQFELLSLIKAIEKAAESPEREFFELVFSSCIIAKSGGVSLARDLAHSRPHRDSGKQPRDAIIEFSSRLGKALRKYESLPERGKRVFVDGRRADNLPLPSDSIDLIVTSPPYANAIDYMRAHKFSLIWFRYALGALSELRAQYLGNERCISLCQAEALPPKSSTALDLLREKDSAKARIVQKYLVEMRAVLSEMRRVLKPGRPAVIVIGPSVMRGVEVRTHEYLAEIGESVGFRIAGVQKRKIDRDRRMLPASFGGNGTSVIEQRMHEEFVIGLVKADEQPILSQGKSTCTHPS